MPCVPLLLVEKRNAGMARSPMSPHAARREHHAQLAGPDLRAHEEERSLCGSGKRCSPVPWPEEEQRKLAYQDTPR